MKYLANSVIKPIKLDYYLPEGAFCVEHAVFIALHSLTQLLEAKAPKNSNTLFQTLYPDRNQSSFRDFVLLLISAAKKDDLFEKAEAQKKTRLDLDATV